jgi:DNA topoisomerase I
VWLGVKLVLVEAPGKVKTIAQYLGPGYKVLATYGHIRSLPSKQGSVRPDEDFAMVWEMLPKSSKAVAAIAKAVTEAKTLILATDLDREGEAISWHVLEYLKGEGLLRPDLQIQRVTFNAITKQAITSALANPRQLDQAMVEAYLARLSLDYLVGFTLSPVLWRKLPGSRSAGRVQSVALRLVVEREQEIRAFQVQEYWTIEGRFGQGEGFLAHLTHFQGQKLDKMAISTGDQAQDMVDQLQGRAYHIDDIAHKRVQRNPSAPFITSSLQQEASRKLGYSPTRTMQVAQKLYEGVDIDGQTVGLITYMRTDSPILSSEAMGQVRSFIESLWGKDYVHPSVRQYKTKAQAQEAHEAIRPTNFSLTPETVRSVLTDDLWKVYKLIWDRSVASQMASAQFDQTTVTLASDQGNHTFRATGSILVFEGFLKVYAEAQDEDSSDEASRRLPPLTKQTPTPLQALAPSQHFTQPPARYSEASLIKTLEDLGIGRPSTYARILQVLQERDYVGLEKKRLFPKELGTVVTAFLRKFFAKYVDYGFTAGLEEQLDDIAQHKMSWQRVMNDFWPAFSSTIAASQDLKVADVLQQIEGDVLPSQSMACPRCQEGQLGLRLGKSGPFLSCSQYPQCSYSGPVSADAEGGESSGPRVIGAHPDTGNDILVRNGPYGWYVQHEGTRASLPAVFKPDEVRLDQALWVLSLPMPLGQHPSTGLEIVMGLGRFGPYVRCDGRFYTLRGLDLQTLTLGQAVEVIDKAPAKAARAPKAGKASSAKSGRAGAAVKPKAAKKSTVGKGAAGKDSAGKSAAGKGSAGKGTAGKDAAGKAVSASKSSAPKLAPKSRKTSSLTKASGDDGLVSPARQPRARVLSAEKSPSGKASAGRKVTATKAVGKAGASVLPGSLE